MTLSGVREIRRVLNEATKTEPAPGRKGRLQLRALASQGSEGSRHYWAAVGSIRVPKTTEARKAGSYLRAYARSASQRVTQEEVRIRRLPPRLSLDQSKRNLDHLEFVLVDVSTLMLGGTGAIDAYVPALKEAFRDADACKKLDAFVAASGKST